MRWRFPLFGLLIAAAVVGCDHEAIVNSTEEVANASAFQPEATSAKLRFNPFGIGVSYVGFKAVSVHQRAEYRANQIRNAATLVGRGGYVRIWCHLGPIWTAPHEDGPYECVQAVQLAHDLALVPVINIQDAPYATDVNPDPMVGYKDFSQYSARVKSLIASLPRPSGRVIWVEMANEPNFTDWWFSHTCSFRVRAREVARQTFQTIQAVRSLTDSRIKILGPSLAPYSDFDPSPTTQQPCHSRGNQLRLPSTLFVEEMLREMPGLFRPTPMFDAWNSHAYPDSVFGHCDENLNNCPPIQNQHGLTAYRNELRLLGLPSEFPVILSEAGYPNNQVDGALRFAKPRGSHWDGYYAQLWFAAQPYNNVRAVIGYVLGHPNETGFNWMEPAQSVGALPAWDSLTPLFKNVFLFRESVLPEGNLTPGRYILPVGTILDARSAGTYCRYRDWDAYLAAGGATDLNNVKYILAVPEAAVDVGVCP